MTKRYPIQVRRYLKGQTKNGNKAIGEITGNYGRYELVTKTQRVLRAEMIGNFNPIFCTYKGKRTLVHSDDGDLSDPFRREEGHLKTLFITV